MVVHAGHVQCDLASCIGVKAGCHQLFWSALALLHALATCDWTMLLKQVHCWSLQAVCLQALHLVRTPRFRERAKHDGSEALHVREVLCM